MTIKQTLSQPPGIDVVRLMSFIRTSALLDATNAWINQVAKGPWDQIPINLTYDQADDLAMLVDGYRVAESLGDNEGRSGRAAAISAEQVRSFSCEGKWIGSAAELWVTLFFSKRADRMILTLGDESRDPRFDKLCLALRTALIEGRLWPTD